MTTTTFWGRYAERREQRKERRIQRYWDQAIWEQRFKDRCREIGKLLGVLTGGAAFLAAWAYCALTYGFLFGFGLGWLPAIILGCIVGVLTIYLWIPVLALALIVAIITAFGG